MTKMAYAVLGAVLVLMPAQAQQSGGSDIMNQVINIPTPKAWTALGVAPPEITDEHVQGGIAKRFEINNKGANPWDVTARNSIVKPVQKGDTLLLAFWARAEVPAEGQQTGILPGIRIEEIAAPYTPVAQDSANVTGTWAMYYASGVATRDYNNGSIGVVIHLAAAKQTIDLGPVFVVDLGQNYPASKLPHNKPVASVPNN